MVFYVRRLNICAVSNITVDAFYGFAQIFIDYYLNIFVRTEPMNHTQNTSEESIPFLKNSRGFNKKFLSHQISWVDLRELGSFSEIFRRRLNYSLNFSGYKRESLRIIWRKRTGDPSIKLVFYRKGTINVRTRIRGCCLARQYNGRSVGPDPNVMPHVLSRLQDST